MITEGLAAAPPLPAFASLPLPPPFLLPGGFHATCVALATPLARPAHGPAHGAAASAGVMSMDMIGESSMGEDGGLSIEGDLVRLPPAFAVTGLFSPPLPTT